MADTAADITTYPINHPGLDRLALAVAPNHPAVAGYITREFESLRERFADGTAYIPSKGFNDWARPCPCGNDGVCCDTLDEDNQ